MGFLYRYSIGHSKRVILAAAVISLATAPGILRLEIQTDGHALVPRDAEEIRTDRSIRDEFGVEDPIAVLIQSDHPKGIFNLHTIRLVHELTLAFKRIRGVRAIDLFSLETEHGDRVQPGTLHFRRFLEPMPTRQEQLDTLREDLRAIELYTGTLVSSDEKATSILVGVPKDADRTAMYEKIRDIIDAQGPIPEDIHVIGAPVAEALLGTHILEDLGVPNAVLGSGTARSEVPTAWHFPRSLFELRLQIAHHIGLVPIAVAIMAAVFLVSFRSFAAAMLPLSEVAACLLFVFGLMGWLEVPVYLTVAVLPIILTAMGIADEIHIFRRYGEHLRDRADEPHQALVALTMEELCIPVVKTSVTTAIAFLSFTLSPIGPVRVFGGFTAIGILFCMIWSLTVIPALLVLIPPRWMTRRRWRDAVVPPSNRVGTFARLGGFVVRHRVAVIALAVVVAATAPLAVARINVQDSWIDGFAPESEFYQATEYFNDHFLGTHILLICVDAGHQLLTSTLNASAITYQTIAFPGDLVDDPKTLVDQRIQMTLSEATLRARKARRRAGRPSKWIGRIESAKREGDRILVKVSRKRGLARASLRLTGGEFVDYEITPQPMMTPEVLHRIGDLEAFIAGEKDSAVGGVLGTADYLATANFMSRGRKESERSIPDDPDRIDWVWRQYQRIRGVERRQQIVDGNYARSLVTVFMKNANFIGTRRLMNRVREYEEEHLLPHGIKLEFAGDVAVSQTLIAAIVKTQTTSLLLSLVGITAITAVMGGSLVWGLLCVLPCALAVLVNFAVMGLVGMPLGVATSMFAGMTLGIGVDYAIHLLERYRRARGRGLAIEPALTDAVAATGPAIFIDALAVALGFGVMTLSQVPANARLGGLVVLSILGCFVATLLLLPAIIAAFSARNHAAATGRACAIPPRSTGRS